jgi:hypothetical protein
VTFSFGFYESEGNSASAKIRKKPAGGLFATVHSFDNGSPYTSYHSYTVSVVAGDVIDFNDSGSFNEGYFFDVSVSVTPAIAITQQPVNATASNGDFSFSVVATIASGNLEYQWQTAAGFGQLTWTNISGATSSTYSRTQATPDDWFFRLWRCIVSCAGTPSVTSASGRIASNPTPTWYGNFYAPDAEFTARFGSVSGTSGSASSKINGSFSDWSDSTTIYAANNGTLRITGTISADGPFTISGTQGPGDSYSGFSDLAVDFSMAVGAGQQLVLVGNYMSGNLQMWLVRS